MFRALHRTSRELFLTAASWTGTANSVGMIVPLDIEQFRNTTGMIN
jgi:hypothetical protein